MTVVCRVKDAGVDAEFPEKFELEIPAAKFSNNLAVRVHFHFVNII